MRLTALLTLLVLAAPLAAAPQVLESGPARVSVVELYTSEGCSSCPPADRWLSDLHGDPRLWKTVIPLAFHVDYWDYIGWADRFATGAYSARQREHATLGNVRSVYTPGFVVDGREWRAWFHREPLAKAMGEDHMPGKLRATVDNGRVEVRFTPSAAVTGPLTVTVAKLGLGLQTRVEAGENEGRTLSHEFVVLGLSRGSLSSEGAERSARLRLPEVAADSPRTALAVWVAQAGSQQPIQAVGGLLKNSP